jgi:hypothetical protein
MPSRHLATVALTLTIGLVGCADEDTKAETDPVDCGEHGDWNDEHSHCHCDEGFELTADLMGCEPEEEDTDTDGSSDVFTPDDISAVLMTGDDPVWLLDAKDGQTWLSVENYPSFGGANGPETRTLDATEVDYATCGVCVLLKTGCEPHGDHAHCETTLMPEVGGQVTIDALGAAAGDSWAGSRSGIRFVEVEIDGSTYATTPVEGGATFTLDAWSFDVVLEAAR